MQQRDWASIDAAVEKLEEFVASVNLPGNHPETLQGVERCLSVIGDANVATDKCAALRTAARRFYADKSRRSRPMSKVDNTHNIMTACISSIRTHVAMLKQLSRA